MQVKLNALKSGDTLYFRCGGKATVRETLMSNFNTALVDIWFVENGEHASSERYWTNGMWGASEHIRDVVKVEPKPFDWDKATWGMAFCHWDIAAPKKYNCIWYAGLNPRRLLAKLTVGENGEVINYSDENLKSMRRVPEYDMKERDLQ
jgi:hypothetical protein